MSLKLIRDATDESVTNSLWLKQLFQNCIKSDGYFPNLGADGIVHFRNLFNENAQVRQAGTSMQEDLVELQHDNAARDVYSEENFT